MRLKQLVAKIFSNGLAKNSLIVFAGNMGANVASYIYHLLMGRMLGPEGYGELSSLLSLLYIFTVPIIVGQTVLVKFISRIKAHGQPGQAKSVLTTVTRLFITYSLVLFPFVFLVSYPVSSFLHLSSSILVIFVYVIFVIALLTIVPLAILQGYQIFVWFSALSSMAIVLKLLISIPLVRFSVGGVLVAAILAGVVAYVFYFFPLRFVTKSILQPANIAKNDALKFAVPTLLTLLGITSLYSIDIILVKHYFSGYDAGLYAALAILGKIIFYASSSVGLVAFPVLSEQKAIGNVSAHLIRMAIIGVSIVSTILVAVYFIFPKLIISMLFGNAYSSANILLGPFATFIAIFSIGYISSTISLAIGKTQIWIVPTISAVFQICAIALFHESILQVILINIASSIILLIGSVIVLKQSKTHV